MKTYICSQCGQESKKYRDQCPHCKTSGDNYVENIYGGYDDEGYTPDTDYYIDDMD